MIRRPRPGEISVLAGVLKPSRYRINRKHDQPRITSSDDSITVRTIVDLPDPERAQLDALCRQRGLSRAEALRQALRLWLQQQNGNHGEVFGLWRDRPEGSLELQQALREESSER